MDLVFSPSQIETWPLDRLLPYARNANIHGTDQVAKITASMAKFGWMVPCMVADDGELTAGHGRVLAAIMLGLKDVPVIRLSHLDKDDRRRQTMASMAILVCALRHVASNQAVKRGIRRRRACRRCAFRRPFPR